MLRKIIIFLVLLASLTASYGQRNLLEDSITKTHIYEGLRATYNFEFKKAEEEIEIISKKDNDIYEHGGDIYTEEYETVIKNIGGEEPLYLELKDAINAAKVYFKISGKPLRNIDERADNDFEISIFHHEMLSGNEL